MSKQSEKQVVIITLDFIFCHYIKVGKRAVRLIKKIRSNAITTEKKNIIYYFVRTTKLWMMEMVLKLV